LLTSPSPICFNTSETGNKYYRYFAHVFLIWFFQIQVRILVSMVNFFHSNFLFSFSFWVFKKHLSSTFRRQENWSLYKILIGCRIKSREMKLFCYLPKPFYWQILVRTNIWELFEFHLRTIITIIWFLCSFAIHIQKSEWFPFLSF